MPNTNLTDGPIKLVEQLVSLLNNAGTPAATNYILKKGSLKAGVDVVKSDDQNGAQRARALALQGREGSMSLQFVAATDKAPQPLQYFSALDASGNTVKLILGEVGESFGTREEAMIECSIFVPFATVSATLPSLTPT